MPLIVKNSDSVGCQFGLLGKQVCGRGVGLNRLALDGAKDVGFGCCGHQHRSEGGFS